jgi:hypothetical protein
VNLENALMQASLKFLVDALIINDSGTKEAFI